MSNTDRNTDLTESKVPGDIALVVFMTLLPTISIVFRFWSRLVASSTEAGLWWDDWLALAAWAGCMIETGVGAKGIAIGFGKHVESLENPDATVVMIMKLAYATGITFQMALICAKLSALLFYRRVFGTRIRQFTIGYWITVGAVAVFACYTITLNVFICYPPQKYWNLAIKGTCIGTYGNFAIVSSACAADVATDLMILLLPMPIISKLHVGKKRKTLLCIAFACGYVAWVTSIGRMGAFIALKPLLEDGNITWDMVAVRSWGIAEIGMSVFSICIPSCFHLFRRLSTSGFSSLFSLQDRTSTSPRSQTDRHPSDAGILHTDPGRAESHNSLDLHGSPHHLKYVIVKHSSFDISVQEVERSDELEDGK